jgi:magnesium-transporting ATPase (P-type)
MTMIHPSIYLSIHPSIYLSIHPSIYLDLIDIGKDGEMLNVKNMTRWCLLAFLQGLLLFVIAVRIIGRW